MRIHRFYTGNDLPLKRDFWLRDEAILWQWNRVLRFRDEQEVILFDGSKTDRLYKIEKIDRTSAHLILVTELERKLPSKHVYLLWSLLKKDNNDLILQKCTELGVSNFVPLLSERSVRDNFNIDRARKIVLEAAEQCGRSNIPQIREPLLLETALAEYGEKIQLLVCQQGNETAGSKGADKPLGLLVGPEGGWSEREKKQFERKALAHIGLGDFTLRAETAAIAAAFKLLNPAADTI